MLLLIQFPTLQHWNQDQALLFKIGLNEALIGIMIDWLKELQHLQLSSFG